MALPKNLVSVFAPPPGAQLAENWTELYAGPRAWWRLTAFPGRVNKLRMRDGRTPLLHKDGRARLKSDPILGAAAGHLPGEWRAQAGGHLDVDDRPLGSNSVRAALRGDALPFDRACLVLAALDLLLSEEGQKDVKLEKHVKLAPAVYRLNGFDEKYFTDVFSGTSNRARFNQLKAATFNVHPDFYRDLGRGKTATHATLHKIDETIRDVLKLTFEGDVEPLAHPNRAEKLARFEYAMFP